MRRLYYISLLALSSVALAASGCATPAPTLAPAAEAQFAEEGPGLASSAENVRLVARIDQWRWNPSELDKFVTPMLLTLENNSDQPVRLRLREIRLMNKPGVHLAALPPYRIRGQVERTVQSPVYGYDSFYVAPYLHHHYTRFPPYDGLFFHDRYYYRTYSPVYATYAVELPTQAMLDRALPEGVIEPGGTVTGFVYFEHVDEEVAERTDKLDLVFTIIDAETQNKIGVIEIPFVIKQG